MQGATSNAARYDPKANRWLLMTKIREVWILSPHYTLQKAARSDLPGKHFKKKKSLHSSSKISGFTTYGKHAPGGLPAVRTVVLGQEGNHLPRASSTVCLLSAPTWPPSWVSELQPSQLTSSGSQPGQPCGLAVPMCPWHLYVAGLDPA